MYKAVFHSWTSQIQKPAGNANHSVQACMQATRQRELRPSGVRKENYSALHWRQSRERATEEWLKAVREPHLESGKVAVEGKGTGMCKHRVLPDCGTGLGV